MKIQVKDLRPNPYRHMEKYPIQHDKVEALKISIGETEFWDNVLARKNGNVYEIAYGHHRLTALQELKIKEVDIPVKEIDDAKMIRIMANENMDDWKSSPAVVNETVSVAKEFIDAEMAKAESWETLNESIKRLFDSRASYSDARTKGAGQTTILKFLGGNWRQWMIQDALAIFKDEKEGTIDRGAVEQMPSMRAAEEFRKAVKSSGVPKEKQREIAEKIINDGNATERATAKTVREYVANEANKKFNEANPKIKIKPHISDYLETCIANVVQINTVLKEVLANADQLDPQRLNNFVTLMKRTIEIINNAGKETQKWKQIE
ncbi:MAG: ParB/RepB/Spo0J family partition protein [Dehalococcoidia bacterium]